MFLLQWMEKVIKGRLGDQPQISGNAARCCKIKKSDVLAGYLWIKSASGCLGMSPVHRNSFMSMLSVMATNSVPPIKLLKHCVNDGFDRIRFISPVSAGKRIRGRFVLIALNVRAGEITQTLKATIEIEGCEKPALIAEWVTQHHFS